jgi:hypothetical protein
MVLGKETVSVSLGTLISGMRGGQETIMVTSKFLCVLLTIWPKIIKF